MQPGETALETPSRRRVAIRDGAVSYAVVAPVDMTMDAVLARIGIDHGPIGLRDRTGADVDPARTLRDCADGDVFAIVDTTAMVTARRGRGVERGGMRSGAAVAAVGSFAVVIVALSPVVVRIPAPLSALLGALIAVSAVAAGVFAVRRSAPPEASPSEADQTADGLGALGGAYAPLALMFAAGLLIAPWLASSSAYVAVICALSAVAVLSAGLALVAVSPTTSGALGAISGTTAVVAGVWMLVLIVGLSPTAACALTLGLAPLALRILPTVLVTARPGMFIDFVRFQVLRWSARQREPEPARPVGAAQAKAMVARSDAQWRAATAVVCLAAAVSAPFAIVPLHVDDMLILVGQIVLALCVAFALMLRSGRSPRGLLRWMPGAAAVVVVVASGVAVVDVVGRDLLGAVALLVLLAAVVVAAVIVPIGRGMRSLAWSRVGDRVDAVAVAFALPAGLLVAGLIGLLRGVMA